MQLFDGPKRKAHLFSGEAAWTTAEDYGHAFVPLRVVSGSSIRVLTRCSRGSIGYTVTWGFFMALRFEGPLVARPVTPNKSCFCHLSLLTTSRTRLF